MQILDADIQEQSIMRFPSVAGQRGGRGRGAPSRQTPSVVSPVDFNLSSRVATEVAPSKWQGSSQVLLFLLVTALHQVQR